MQPAAQILKCSPSAQLSVEEIEQFNRLAVKIQESIEARMTFSGIDFMLDPREGNDNVMNALALALRPLKYGVQVQKIMGSDGLFTAAGAIPKQVAWAVKIIPTPDAYEEAGVIPAWPRPLAD